MAKASITNIRAPSKTSVWTPPKSNWDLNNETDRDSYFAWNFLADDDLTNDGNNAAFNGLFGQVNFSVTGWDAAEVSFAQSYYQYIFLGVNGGVDETVRGVTNKSGIIVTGNGKDTVHGGNAGDLIMTGNGKDTVYGGSGDDIIYGENGDDTLNGGAGNDFIDGGNGDDVLNGDAGNDHLFGEDGNDILAGGTDNGVATWAWTPPETIPGEPTTTTVTQLKANNWINEVPTGTTVAGFGEIKPSGYSDNSGSLKKEGEFLKNGTVHQLWSFDSADMTPVNVLNAVTFTVTVYSSQQGSLLDTIGTFTAMENQKVYFSLDLSVYSEGGNVQVYANQATSGTSLKSQSFASLSSYYETVTTSIPGEDQVIPGYWTFTYGEAGDVLTGGAGADTFVYAKGDGVDAITDYTRGEDSLKLVGFSETEQAEMGVIVDGNDSIIVFGNTQNAAIKIVGVNDFSLAEVTFA